MCLPGVRGVRAPVSGHIPATEIAVCQTARSLGPLGAHWSEEWGGVRTLAGGLRRGAVMLAVLIAAILCEAVPAGAVATVPPELALLEQTMEQLQVRSERFSVLSRGTVKVTNQANGKPVGRSRYVSLNGSETGVVSLSLNESEVSTTTSRGRSKEIVIGSTAYTRSPLASKLARLDGGRPWVRSHSDAGTVFPYHGSSQEVNAGGAGPYAGLINLLATATGEVVQVGPVSVNGQPATEFEAAVDPLELLKGLTQEDVANLQARPPAYHLTVYLTAAGVPLRVVEVLSTPPGSNTISSTSITEVLALEVPVAVKAPPANKTISAARFTRLAEKHGKELGVEESK